MFEIVERVLERLRHRAPHSRSRYKAKDLVYASDARCLCGAGLAYPKVSPQHADFGFWDCSAILLGTADERVVHDDRRPFAFYKIRSELQSGACGRTTRP